MDIILVDPHFSSLYPDNEFNLSIGLVKLGHNVKIYTSSRFPPRFFGKQEVIKQEEELSGFQVIRIPALVDIKEIPIMLSLPSFLVKEKPDVFHAQEYYQYCSLQTFNLAKKKRIPFIFTQHRHYYPSGLTKIFFKLCEKTLWEKVIYGSDRITSITSVARNFLVKRHKLNPEKIDVIPHSVNTEFFKPGLDRYYLRNKLGLEEEPLVLFVARLVQSKGAEYAIRAMAKVVMEKSEAKLAILGRGKDEGYFRGLIRKLNLKKSVFILTDYVPMDEMPLVYASADIFVLPTLKDILPISLLEAMASGLPVVATKTGGIPDILKNEINGYLIECPNVDDISYKIINLVSDEKLANKLSIGARRTAEEKFSCIKVAEKTLETYNKVFT